MIEINFRFGENAYFLPVSHILETKMWAPTVLQEHICFHSGNIKWTVQFVLCDSKLLCGYAISCSLHCSCRSLQMYEVQQWA